MNFMDHGVKYQVGFNDGSLIPHEFHCCRLGCTRVCDKMQHIKISWKHRLLLVLPGFENETY